MRLILMRHGETLWNQESRLQGHDNSSLSNKGIQQAEKLKDSIRLLSPVRIICSDLGRARQTAGIIGYSHAITDPALRELHMGEWTGLRKPDLIADEPEKYWQWRKGLYTPPGGESWEDFCQRIHQALMGWIEKEDTDLLAIVHSGVIRAACKVFMKLPPENLLPVTPATLTIFNIEQGKTRLEAYNIGAFIPDADAAD
ncbi:histidine phosphatase family protein [Serratia aquatilis]|uniref:Histidine phosphatase family protein n=1 Tax=Serratia aquatilis TaxID=1737515 RepID=A0ABV6ECF2_9GAMM